MRCRPSIGDVHLGDCAERVRIAFVSGVKLDAIDGAAFGSFIRRPLDRRTRTKAGNGKVELLVTLGRACPPCQNARRLSACTRRAIRRLARCTLPRLTSDN